MAADPNSVVTNVCLVFKCFMFSDQHSKVHIMISKIIIITIIIKY